MSLLQIHSIGGPIRWGRAYILNTVLKLSIRIRARLRPGRENYSLWLPFRVGFSAREEAAAARRREPSHGEESGSR